MTLHEIFEVVHDDRNTTDAKTAALADRHSEQIKNKATHTAAGNEATLKRNFEPGRLLGVGKFCAVYEAIPIVIEAGAGVMVNYSSSSTTKAPVPETTYVIKKRRKALSMRMPSSASSLSSSWKVGPRGAAADPCEANESDDEKESEKEKERLERERLDAIADLEREAGLLATLDHPNVIKLRCLLREDAGQGNDKPDLEGDAQMGEPMLLLDRLRGTLADRIAMWRQHGRDLDHQRFRRCSDGGAVVNHCADGDDDDWRVGIRKESRKAAARAGTSPATKASRFGPQPSSSGHRQLQQRHMLLPPCVRAPRQSSYGRSFVSSLSSCTSAKHVAATAEETGRSNERCASAAATLSFGDDDGSDCDSHLHSHEEADGAGADDDVADAFLAERLRAALDVARGMRYLHSRGVAHRDLKPDNVGYDDNGSYKIFDFGLAKRLVDVDVVRDGEDGINDDESGIYRKMTSAVVAKDLDQTNSTSATGIVSEDFNENKDKDNGWGHHSGLTGTLRYMAPEVARSKEYGLTADVYSFGMLLWELCSLARPFGNITKRQLQERVHRSGGGGKNPRGRNHHHDDIGIGRFHCGDESSSSIERHTFHKGSKKGKKSSSSSPYRPKLSKSWPSSVRDIIERCWSDDPSDRTDWDDVIDVLRREIDRSMSLVPTSLSAVYRTEHLRFRATMTTMSTTTMEPPSHASGVPPRRQRRGSLAEFRRRFSSKGAVLWDKVRSRRRSLTCELVLDGSSSSSSSSSSSMNSEFSCSLRSSSPSFRRRNRSTT